MANRTLFDGYDDSSTGESESEEDIYEKPERYSGYVAAKHEKNVQPSAVNFLTTIPNVTGTAVQQWLHVARPVTVTEDMYDDIIAYVNNSQDHNFGLKILNMMRIERAKEHELQNDGKLRMLLWHGTQAQYVPGILQTGFKRPANKGGMFGTGIYFADRASKSAQYCFPGLKVLPGGSGYMFLCEVVIGDSYNAKNAKNEFTQAPNITGKSGRTRPCDSVKCTGENIPDRQEQKKWGKAVVPLGKTIKNTKFTTYTVRYNEFIIYAEDRVKIRYLIKVQFTQQRVVN